MSSQKINIQTSFKIGSRVYHRVSGEPGIVLSYRYTWSTDTDGDLLYYISWGPEFHTWLYEKEISEDKPVECM